MVRLTMTATIVAALEHRESSPEASTCDFASSRADNDPPLEQPAVGRPIKHAQVLALWKHLREQRQKPGANRESSQDAGVPDYDLDTLLRGSQVYLEPPKPKPEPSDEYKALMTRLRAEEEERKYAALLNPPLPINTNPQTFAQRYANSPYVHLFPDSALTTSTASKSGSSAAADASVLYDELSFRDINRQLALIANVLISILACSVAIWWGTWHWSPGWRLGASMGGSGLVGVAEVVVYMGYVARMESAKSKERTRKERKEVQRTWVIEGRKGVREKRVVRVGDGDAGENATTGAEWVGAPRMARQRKAE